VLGWRQCRPRSSVPTATPRANSNAAINATEAPTWSSIGRTYPEPRTVPLQSRAVRRPLLTTLVLALLACGLVTGCGGGDGKSSNKADVKQRFDTAYRPINDGFLVLGNEVGQTIQTAKGKSDSALATTFSSQASRLGALKARLDALEPPPEDEADAKKLSDAMGVVEDDLRGISDSATAHDAAAARSGVQALARHSVAVRTARRELARKTGARVD
jgi:hypothetical protein